MQMVQCLVKGIQLNKNSDKINCFHAPCLVNKSVKSNSVFYVLRTPYKVPRAVVGHITYPLLSGLYIRLQELREQGNPTRSHFTVHLQAVG